MFTLSSPRLSARLFNHPSFLHLSVSSPPFILLPYIHPSIHPWTRASIHLPIHHSSTHLLVHLSATHPQSIQLPMLLSIHPSVYPSIHPCTHPSSICPSISIDPCLHPSIYPPVYTFPTLPSIHPSIHPSICLSRHPSVCGGIHPPTKQVSQKDERVYMKSELPQGSRSPGHGIRDPRPPSQLCLVVAVTWETPLFFGLRSLICM